MMLSFLICTQNVLEGSLRRCLLPGMRTSEKPCFASASGQDIPLTWNPLVGIPALQIGFLEKVSRFPRPHGHDRINYQ